MTIEERIEAAQILYAVAEERLRCPIGAEFQSDENLRTDAMLRHVVEVNGSMWLRGQLASEHVTNEFVRVAADYFGNSLFSYDTEYADWFLNRLDVAPLGGDMYVLLSINATANLKRRALERTNSPNDEVFEFHIAGAQQLLFEDYGATKHVTLLIEEVPVRLTEGGSFQVALGDVRKLTKARIVGEVFRLPGS